MGSEEITRQQRMRLIAAMIEAVRRRGYEGVTVAEVVALAGVSKSAFYKLFSDKEACFLTTYELLVEQGAEQIETAYRSGEGLREGMTAAFEQFVETTSEHTAAARLVFVDSLSIGAAAIPAQERTAARYESMITRSFAAAPLPGEVSPAVIRAVFGGLRDFAFHCLRDHEPERLGEHVPELVDWGVGYREAAARGSKVGARLAAQTIKGREAWASGDPTDSQEALVLWEEPANSPRSRKELSQRERIMRATAQVAAEVGYGALTVPAISAASGTSNQSFYKHFGSKEKAFLAGFDALALQAFEVTSAAFATKDGWLEAGSAAILAVLEFIAANRLFQRINFFELHAAGPIARDRAEAMLSLFTAFMQPDPLPPEAKTKPPKVVIEAIAGGVWAVIQHEITAGRGDSLPDLLPEMLDIVLLPFGLE
jgi:AcrR family transcriptional regulator